MSIKISELPAATSVGNNDVLPIVQSGTTKKAAASLLKTTISSTINSSSTNDTAAGSKAVYDYSAPISHSTSATTYGVGTASNYGHCKTINNLTTASYVAGEALSAHQGKVLNDTKEDIANKTDTIDENSTSTQYPNAEATYQAISTVEGNLTAEISDLQAKNEALRNQIPTYTATGTAINVKDSSNLPIKDFSLLGNASQNGTPTPDSPVPISVVTGDNTLTFTGKNLFDKDNADWKKAFLKTNGTEQTGSAANSALMPTNYYNAKPSTTYHLSFEFGTNADFVQQILVSEYDINQNHIQRTNIINTNSLTTQSNTAYLRISFYNLKKNNEYVTTDSTTPDLFIKNIQLEVGSTATTYEPYTSQTQLLSLGDIELAKIGSYQDRIYKSGDKWYLEKNTAKFIANGTESWTYNGTQKRGYTSYTGLEINFKQGDGLSNYFEKSSDTTRYTGFGFDSSYLYLRISESITTKSEFLDWLEEHPTTFIGTLAAPTYTEITDTTLIQQLKNVLAMSTYKNETNGFWVITAGNVEGEMQIEYYQDIATLFEELRNAIVSL